MILTVVATSFKVCSVEGCENSGTIVKDLCRIHYERHRKYGDVHFVKTILGIGNTSEEKFWSRVNKTKGLGRDGDCWEWLGYVGTNGYGSVTVNKRVWTTHRYVWLIVHHQEPTKCILHSCDNKICVNPSHLREGGHKENALDAVERGQKPVGEQHWKAKLSSDQVQKIRQAGNAAKAALEFGISPHQAWAIKTGKSWKWLS